MEPVSILYLEDSSLDMELSLAFLTRAGIQCQAHRVETEKDFATALSTKTYDLILADYALPSFDGIAALKLAAECCPETPFVFVSGALGEEVAIDSLHRGATDYVFKQRLERLVPAVRRALNEAKERVARKAAEIEREALLEREKAARAEAELRAQELRQVNAELERFAYAASHDLQEPLRMVKAYAQLLTRRYKETVDEDGAEYIGYIEQGVDRMEQLIRDLLGYSRVVHDRSHSFQPVALETIIQQSLNDLHTTLQETDANVSVGPMPVVLGDGERISHVFQNLLSNSLKYRDGRTPQIEIAAQQKGKEWTVSVRDNGIGFSKEYAEQIFGLFKRLHGREYPGTGLGLAIARRIVEQHGGRMWAESIPGEGATFFFTLPPA